MNKQNSAINYAAALQKLKQGLLEAITDTNSKLMELYQKEEIWLKTALYQL